jgi:hypothetical protein
MMYDSSIRNIEAAKMHWLGREQGGPEGLMLMDL